MIEIVGKEELEEFIWENTNEKKIIMIYFGAEWCGPCQALKKKLATSEAKNDMPDLVVAYLDMDQEKNEDISNTYSVRSLPTLIYVGLKSTQIVEHKRIIGFDWANLTLGYKELDKLRNHTSTDIPKKEEPIGANSINYD